MSYLTGLACIRCGAEYPIDRRFQGCPKHDGNLVANVSATYDYDAIRRDFSREALRDRDDPEPPVPDLSIPEFLRRSEVVT